MKKFKRIICTIITVLLMASCHKERTIHVTAINPATKVPWSNLSFLVTEEKTGFNGEKYKTAYEGTLNENGEAMFNFKARKNRSYTIQCKEPPNICFNKNIEYSFTIHDNKKDFVFEMTPCAYLKLKFQNVNCQGSGDYFKLYYLGRIVGGQGAGIVGALIKEGAGCYFFETTEFSNVPMGERYYKWEVTRSGVTNTYYDTLYLNQGEYKTYEINY